MSVYKINNVLVPVDLSESSLNALDVAVNIAQKNEAALQVLNVEENILFNLEDISTSHNSNPVNSADVLQALTGAIQHTHGIQPKVIHEEGNVSDVIIKTAFLQQCDLIVMGCHGASGYREGFIGSNTYNVIKYASCPVLSVPRRKKITAFQNILFPIRPVTGALMPYNVVSHFANTNAVMEVLGLSFRITETGTSVLDTIVGEIKEQLIRDKVTTKLSWTESNTIADEIVRYANKISPDLIVVTTALDVISKAKYIGPHAQKIIHCSKSPVLSIKKVGVPSFA